MLLSASEVTAEDLDGVRWDCQAVCSETMAPQVSAEAGDWDL